MEILAFSFMQRALAAGVLIALACSVLGVFLVLRRDAMLGHGLAHVTFGGVALGLLMGVSPIWTALAVAMLSAVVLLKLRDAAGLHGDTAIGILSSVGFALGVVLASVSGRFSVELFSYLFGNILAIGMGEVWTSTGLAAAVVAAVVLNYHDLVAATFDHDMARTSGVPVARLDVLLTILSAVTVVLAMKVVGLLLVAALIVIPAAAALQVAANFRSAIFLSALAGVLSVVWGLWASYYLDLPASGAIVLLQALLFGAAWAAARVLRRGR
ncbi:MAG: metal ABC transporter permease [bacterium]|nr:MAG: metal ABC transporter permease [bacterium]